MTFILEQIPHYIISRDYEGHLDGKVFLQVQITMDISLLHSYPLYYKPFLLNWQNENLDLQNKYFLI